MCHSNLFTEPIDDVNLVFHQCNERRNNDCSALHDQGRKLIAEALSTSGWHQNKGIMALQQIADNGFLVALELVKAEIMFQLLCKICVLCHTISTLLPYQLMIVWFSIGYPDDAIHRPER